MEGLFHNTDPTVSPYMPYEIDDEMVYWYEITMDRDVGPFTKGTMVTSANWNMLTGTVVLETRDGDDTVLLKHTFNALFTVKE